VDIDNDSERGWLIL